MTSKAARVAFRLLPKQTRLVVHRVARIAGVSTAVALRHAVAQRALDGRTRFSVPGKDGSVATYDPKAVYR